mgnify:CR=1 FL=1
MHSNIKADTEINLFLKIILERNDFGFAKSLLNKGANIAEISKALGHSNLALTTKYLHLDKEEVADEKIVLY